MYVEHLWSEFVQRVGLRLQFVRVVGFREPAVISDRRDRYPVTAEPASPHPCDSENLSGREADRRARSECKSVGDAGARTDADSSIGTAGESRFRAARE
jgi:hypothetical protein